MKYRNYSKKPMTENECLKAIAEQKSHPTPTPEVFCKSCQWIHEADSVKKTSRMGVKLCPLHARAVNCHEELLASLKEYKEAARNGTVVTLGMARRSEAAIAKANPNLS